MGDLSALSRQELQGIFKELGIKGANAKNADLIETIKQHRQAIQTIEISMEAVKDDVVIASAAEPMSAEVINDVSVTESSTPTEFTVSADTLQDMIAYKIEKEMPAIVERIRGEVKASSTIKKLETLARPVKISQATKVEVKSKVKTFNNAPPFKPVLASQRKTISSLPVPRVNLDAKKSTI